MSAVHSTGKIVKNTILFTGALLGQKIISLGYFFYLSSRLGPEVLGAYVWALSFTTLFSIGMDLGLSPILIREAAKTDTQDEKYLRTVIGLKLPLIFITLIISLFVLFLTKSDPIIIALVLGATGVMLFDAFSLTFYSFLRSKQKLGYEAMGIIIFQMITLVGGVLLLELTGNIVMVMLSLTTASFVNMIYSGIIIKKKLGYSLRPMFDKPTVKYFFRIMPAFALSGIFVRIYNVSDSVLLGYMKDNASVGLFSIPAKAVTAFQALIPGAFQATIYPSMSNYYATSRERLINLFEKSFNYLTFVSIPIALGLFIIAGPVLQNFWPKYTEATLTFKVMALAIPFIFLAFPTGLLLRAADRQNANTLNRGIITVIAVVMNILLIPKYGVLGAGISYLVVNIILLFLDFIFVEKVIKYSKKNIIIYFCKTLLAGMGMLFVVDGVLYFTSVYVAVLAGAMSYLVFAVLLRIIKKNELEFLKNIFIKSKKVTEVPEPLDGEKID